MTQDEIKLLEMQRLFFPNLPVWEYNERKEQWYQVWPRMYVKFDPRKNYRIQALKPITYPRSGRIIPGAT